MEYASLRLYEKRANLLKAFAAEPAIAKTPAYSITVRRRFAISDELMTAFMGEGEALERDRKRGKPFGIQDDEAEIGGAVILEAGLQHCRERAATETLAIEIELSRRDQLRARTDFFNVKECRWPGENELQIPGKSEPSGEN